MKITIYLLVVLSSWQLFTVESFRILGVFQHTGYSHYVVFEPLLIRLAELGHQVTVISHFPSENPLKNFKDISLYGSLPIWKSVIDFDEFNFETLSGRFWRHYTTVNKIIGIGIKTCEVMLQNEEVKSLKQGDFDVMIVQDFSSSCSMGLVYKLKIPHMVINSHVMTPWTMDSLGLVQNPAFVSNSYLSYGYKPDTFEAVESFLVMEFFRWYFYFYSQIPEREIVKGFLGTDIPPLETIARNVSLILSGTYFSINGAYPIPPNVVEIGGIHLGQPKQLPKDIEKYLDESTEGVILFSMGSMLKTTSMDKDKLKVFQDVFSELSENVLWKWEDDVMINKPNNVKILEWIPQYDILCHKNVKAFITHAGMAGLIETVSCGVPVLALPIFGDQFCNAAALRDSGIGFLIKYDNITKESIGWALRELLNPKMKARAEKAAAIWHDRPMNAMDTAVYWVEHVARHGGSHLQPASKDLPLFRYLLLDVFMVLIILLFVVYKMVRYCLKIFINSKSIKVKKN